MNVKLGGLLALTLLLGAGHWAQSSMAQEFLPRIVGGNVVPDDRYPFMAALYRDADGDGNFFPTCGGSLLGDQWVLTAAHCVVDADSGAVHRVSEVALLLGTRDLSSSGGLFIRAQRIIVHPGYSTSDFGNDIALIELVEAVDGRAITLPSAASALPEIGESAVVAGWGVTRENGEPSSLLREVAVPIVSHAQCLPYYPETLQQALQLCAGGSRAGGQDSCQGDSGGPLFIARGERLVQVGVVSFGEGCARPGIPGVYTRVTQYLDWLSSFVSDLEILDVAPGDAGQVSEDDVPISGVLVLEQPRQGSISRGDADLYEVTSAAQVDVLTRSGDADLFIVSGTRFDIEDIVCVSDSIRDVDSCAVPVTGERMFALVFGYLDSSYEVIARSAVGGSDGGSGGGSGGSGSDEADVTQLFSGAAVSGSVDEGSATIFEVSGGLRVDLITQSGDADLYIATDTVFNDSSLVCESETTEALDRCELPDVSPLYAAVYGYETSSYVVEVVGRDVRPADDDPNSVAADASRSGGGALGTAGLLLLFVWHCRRSIARLDSPHHIPDVVGNQQ